MNFFKYFLLHYINPFFVLEVLMSAVPETGHLQPRDDLKATSHSRILYKESIVLYCTCIYNVTKQN